MTTLAGGLLLLWTLGMALLLLRHGRTLFALMREPVLRHPVLIVESDDWGAGPESQAEALRRIAEIMERHRDGRGNPPVMTLAIVLAVPDGPSIAATGRYHRLTLCASRFRDIRDALDAGVARGLFALQLHGMEHYWPDTLMAERTPTIRRWLEQQEPATTEELPPHLQSRWTDARSLPSRPLPEEAVARATAEEAALYAECFGAPPRVAVPTTFVWDEQVEAQWSRHGVRIVITPGVRNRCRDAHGKPGCQDRRMYNGEQGQGVVYLVRDDYFEPELGHRPEQAVAALARKTAQGRPCLLETHRSNFLGTSAHHSLEALDQLYAQALEQFPSLHFMSSERLAEALEANDPALIETRRSRRLACFAARLEAVPGLSRLARLTGLLSALKLAGKAPALLPVDRS